ncbi:hypothetical protein THAOC_19158, partial [Thalassiosira oceanica]
EARGMTAIEEASPLASQNEGGPGEGGAFTRAASGARRAPTAADEAPYPSYDANDDPTDDDCGPMDERRVLGRYGRHDGPAGASHGHVDDGGGPGPPVKARGRRGKHIVLEKAPSGR